MLNITAQKNAAGAKAYFAKGDYYSEGQEVVGDWGGKGAVLLGLLGRVDQLQFDRLCDNVNPATGKPLTALTRDGRRVGYDFTWSAPKSVSVVHALTGDERIVDAFRASIRDTMAEMEQEMHARVRKGRRDEDRLTGNLTWAEFVHLTSRPVNGVPCPQLHSHVFCFNATYDAAEGQWKAGQFGPIKQDSYYWQAVQQARFATRLQDMGYDVRRTKDAFEIAGVPEATLKKFSLRTALIERAAMALGITSPAAKAKLAATTREAKKNALPYSALKDLWNERLDPAERAALSDLPGAGDRLSPAVADRAHARFAVEHAFERASVVDERRLLTLALRHGCGEVTPEGVRTELGRCGLLRRREGGRTWTTTTDVLAEERAMIRFAVAGRGTVRPLSAQERSPAEASASHVTLSAEQQRAVDHVLDSPDRATLLRGSAGTGKTTLTREAVRRIEAAGKPVVMLAPSAQASRGVLRDEGFDRADTLSRFLADERMQATARNGVIWLDEAGLVGSRTMAALFRTAGSLNARVVLAGDKRQLASVERGHALRVLEDVAGLPCAEVRDIRRQSGQYKEAVKLLARGDAAGGFAKLDAMGCVKELEGRDAYAPLVREYVDAVRAGRSALIVCPTHAEGDRVTEQVRAELKREGVLGEGQRTVERLVPTQWTEAERGDVGGYAGDEVLQFHRSAGRYRAGDRAEAKDGVGDLHRMRGCFTAYRRGTIELSAGDTIRVTASGKTADGKHRLNNGSQYTVAGFTRAGDVRLGNGWVIGRGFGHLAHGYVGTAHAAQGRTVDRVLVAASAASYPAVTRENFYVAASRARHAISVWTDDKQELAERVGRSDARRSATELMGQARPPHLHRLRQAIRRVRTAAVTAAKAAAREVQRVVGPTEHAHDR